MKYQRYIVAKHIHAGNHELRRFRTAVKQQGNSWIPIGDPVEETGRVTRWDMLLDIGEYEEDAGDIGPLSELSPPEGWAVVARWWIKDDFVPESREVEEEHERRAIEHLRELGVWRD